MDYFHFKIKKIYMTFLKMQYHRFVRTEYFNYLLQISNYQYFISVESPSIDVTKSLALFF